MEIIKKGRYLEPDFHASSLTISQLLGVLHYHNIVCTPPPRKSKLVGLFDAEIKPKALQFKEERLKVVIASAEGIIDGHTGQPLKARSPKRRRSPGKSAVAGLSRKAGTAKPGKLTRELGQNVVEHDEQMEQV
ncbi:hypothetical protein B0H11DRAFT_2238669 [Mycena galericulata]|nr:hypothetical protein B0H11DRAFT_2238669 [Mycena galericulata]